MPKVRADTTSASTSTTAPPAVAPLTGLAVFNPEVVKRPAVMVKVGDDPKARPQSGLDKADIVYEERVEGNTVRFLAVFQSQDAESVGPIRSVRSTDAPVMTPIGGVFTCSGGIPPFVSLAKKSGATVITEEEQPNAFHLRSDRERPYKTYADTAELRARADHAAAPPALFSFLPKSQPFASAAALPASQATVAFGGRTTARWDWDATKLQWKRSINGLAQRTNDGVQLAFTNVILQTVPYRGTPYKDQADAGVDEGVSTGTGTAVLLTAGMQIPLRWSKPANKSVTTFTDTAGLSIQLPAGRTWVALVPTGTPVSIVNPAGATTTAPAGVTRTVPVTVPGKLTVQ